MAKLSPDKASPWPTPEERARGRAAKREAVLSAAVELFNDRGFRETSLDDVAEKLGVSKPTIYHYFPTKEDILYECLEMGVNEVKQALKYDAEDNQTGLEHLRNFLLLYAKSATSRFTVCTNKTDDHDLSEDKRAKFRDLKRGIDAAMRQMITEGVKDGSIEVEDVRIASFAIAGALNAISRWYHPRATSDADVISTAIVSFLLRSLEPRSSRPQTRAKAAGRTARRAEG